MASVDLNHVYLHDSDDLSNWMRFWTMDRSDQRAVEGAVRSYAAGRRRLITTPTRQRELPVTFRLVANESLEQLDEWAGRLLLYRDHRGRMLYGTYLTIAVSDFKDPTLGYDVGVVFEMVTRAFGV